ncbi:MAG: hypothetical protein FWE96_01955 [Coriobacteriia bacterium]|nr:hypothetical protein [Coriobacteriia bacterium]
MQSKGRITNMLAMVRRNVLQILCLLVILALAVYRLFFGVELTDESYYLSASFRYLQGNIPFFDAWDAHVGSSLFSLPALALFYQATGGTEGIFLFFRLSFFCFMLLMGLVMYLATKSVLGRSTAFLAASVLIVVAPFSLYNWSYNNLSLVLLCAGLFLLAFSLYAPTAKSERIAQVFAGILLAFMVFVYFTQALTCLFVAVLFTVMASIKKKSIPKGLQASLFTALGGLGIAIVLTIPLLLVTQGKLLSYLPNVTSNPAVAAGGSSLFHALYGVVVDTLRFIYQYWLPLALGAVGILAVQLFKKRYPHLVILAPFFLILILFWLPNPKTTMTIIEFTAFIGLFWFLWIPFINKHSVEVKTLFWLLGLGGLISFLCVSLSSAGGAFQGKYMFFCLMLAVLMPVLEDIIRLPQAPIKQALTCVPVILLSGSLLLLWYQAFYRDAPISQLTTRVEQGIFAGVYTTPERAAAVMSLEEELSRLQRGNQSVLFLGHAHPAYTMIEMRAATPTVWIVDFSHPMFSDWFPLYYSQGESFKPDLIIFIEDETYQSFLANQDLELSGIIIHDYSFTEEVIVSESSFHIRLFTRNAAS